MLHLLESLEDLWNEHGFVFLFIASSLFLLGWGIVRKIMGKNGSWSKTFSYIRGNNLSSPSYNTSSKKFESKGEAECRRVLEQYFRKPFPSRRPDFMKNSITKSNLELDGFNPHLRIAFEYHGVQHYKFTPRFHSSKQAFYNQQYRDKETRELCRKNGVFLIEIPYNVKHRDIEKFILNILTRIAAK